MNGEIDRKVLHSAIMRIEECSSLCAIDTVVRIEDGDDKLYACRNCVFRDMLKEEFCPSEVKQEIRGLI